MTTTNFTAGSVEGSIVRMPNSSRLVLSHPYKYGTHPHLGDCRCNLTIWASDDSGATWDAIAQVEEEPSNVHDAAAYSSMQPLNQTHVVLVYERGDYKFLTRKVQRVV